MAKENSPPTESPNNPDPASVAEAPPRRNFLVSFFAVTIGAVISLFPLAPGIAVLLDPVLRRKKKTGDGAETVAVHAKHLADLRTGAVEIGDLGICRLGREMREIDVGALRDHQHMHRRLRVDIVESQCVGGF